MTKSERYKRNLKIKKFREKHPEYSLEEIGQMETPTITASGVFYILKRMANNTGPVNGR